MSKLIALDAGHGRYTAGKRCLKSLDPNETREWVLNDRIAGYIAAMLTEYGCRTIRVDDTTGATDVPLLTRCARANNAGADFFLSVHHNAGINGKSGGGVCAFIATTASATSKKMRDLMYKYVVKETSLKGNRAQPLQEINFTVVYSTKMPAVLFEYGFMDSPTDIKYILTDEFAQKAALGSVRAIVEILGLKRIAQPVPENPASDEPTEIDMGVEVADMSPPSWATASCDKAIAAGIFQGNGNGDYMWDESMTRAQVAVVLDRLGLINNKTEE